MAQRRTEIIYTISFLTLTFISTFAHSSPLDAVWSTDRFIERDLLEPERSENDRQIILRYLELTLDALKSSLIYIDSHVEDINLDGIIGPRQSESKIGYLVSRYWTILPPHVSRTMKEILVAAEKLSAKGDQIVQKVTPQYYANSYPLIKPHFYDLFFPARRINSSMIEIFEGRRKAFSEKESDDCLTEFFGNTGKPKCKISEKCWSTMVGRRQRHYSLTHEVFYLLNGIQANCIEEVSKMALDKNSTTPTQLLDFYCANIYNEAIEIERKGFETGIRDLFMEQIGLCGDAGYVEMAQWRWLKLILGWQRSNGCFGLFKGEHIDPRNFEPNRYGKVKRSAPSQIRRKRTEQMMSSDGCLSHRISVAISALNTYVRRLVGHYIGETV